MMCDVKGGGCAQAHVMLSGCILSLFKSNQNRVWLLFIYFQML